MSKHRITTPTETPVLSRKQAEELLGNLAAAIIRKNAIHAEIDAAALSARQEHEKELTDLTASIEDATEQLQAFADDNAELFEKKKSLEMTHGVIGFRMGTPAAKTLKGWTWKKVVKAVKALKPRLQERFLRVTTTENKEAFIAQRRRKKFLAKIGVEIVQTETFFIEPKLETVTETPIKTAA